ncbi:RHS repeat domain-containing protein [Parvularcula dongshanensis]|uniref:RHS repeat domain-containing protein n=1 Tax=Parvularcula dongshanensis TaxID=1173995 RepID=UPI00161C4BCF|nr:RHS repeat-associated core domain-containing protein [Parvularcula dongshanensis]
MQFVATSAVVLFTALSVLGPNQSTAQPGQWGTETKEAPDWTERHKPNLGLTPHDETLLGDAIDLQSGRLSFEHVDVSIAGNSDLPVEIRRRLNPSQMQSGDFADWRLAIPTISTKILADEWIANTRWGKQRCSASLASQLPEANWPKRGTNSAPPAILPSHYSDGVLLDVPGRASGQLLDKWTPGPNPTATKGWPAAAKKVTADGWYFTCLTNIDGAGTEGFIGHAPNGDTYRFDVVVKSNSRASEFDTWTVQWEGGSPQEVIYREVGVYYDTLAVSRVEDVNGNWVEYKYDNNGWLTRIESNDGRIISINRTSHFIDSVTSNPGNAGAARTWSYDYMSKSVAMYDTYAATPGWGTRYETWSTLGAVTLPDGRKWSLDLANLQARAVPGGNNCKQKTKTVSVTHPDGVKGTFTIAEVALHLGMGATGQTGPYCPNSTGGQYPTAQLTDVMAATKKTLSAAGVPTATWTYSYVTDNDETETTIIAPDNSKRVLYYPTPYSFSVARNHDNLRREELFSSASAASPLETKDYTYILEPEAAGSTFVSNPVKDVFQSVRKRDTAITRGADWYKTRNTYAMDRSLATYSWGFPTKVEQWSNTAGDTAGKRYTDTTYIHKKDKWVLGLSDTVERNGKLFDDYDYDSLGRVTKHKRFGATDAYTVATYGYHTGDYQLGALYTVTDALGRTTKLHNYYRGTPKVVERADGTTLSRVMDDNGWLTSFTDAMNVTTGYAYDSMGRLKKITRPGSWEPTVISYSGLGSGIVQTVTRGALETQTTYDAMLRPILVRTRSIDGGRGGATLYTKTAYDALGRAAFTSLPSNSASPTKGVYTDYDALGRPTYVRERASASGTIYAQTHHSYLDGNLAIVQDPEGHLTYTYKKGWGGPDDGVVKLIDDVEVEGGVHTILRRTSMSYDPWGNLRTAKQSGPDGGGGQVAQTQKYRYDDKLQLCRHWTNETGSRLYRYYPDSSLQYEAPLPGVWEDTCGTLPADRITRTYTLLAELKKVDYSDTTPDTNYTYWPDGSLRYVLRGGIDWHYDYWWIGDEALLKTELLNVDGRTYTTQRGFATDGATTSTVFPTGLKVGYAPDAYGRPKTAQKWASDYYARNLSYRENGLLAHLEYANGYVLDQHLNERQQLWRKHIKNATTYALSMGWEGYDKNGRVTNIDDYTNRSNDRDFGYDGLGRLTDAHGPWGQGFYTYDALGNLRQKKLGAKTVDLEYTGTNRLWRYKGAYQGSSTNGAWRGFGYDGRGNVKSDGLNAFEYDLSDQPFKFTGQGRGSVYRYDGHKRRVKQTRDNGEVIYSVYTMDGTLVHRDQIKPNGTRNRTDYVRAGGELVTKVTNGTPTYMHNDHLGTPVAATDAAGTVLWTELSTPYGEEWSRSGGWNDDAGFTGHVDDEDTDLTYMQARYYNPIVGRFYANDPLRFSVLRPETFTRYAYVGGDPINVTDPDGECPWCVVGAFVGGGLQLIDEVRSGKLDLSDGIQRSDLQAGARVALASGAGALGVGTGAKILGSATTVAGRAVTGAIGGGLGGGIAESGNQIGDVSAGRSTVGEAVNSVAKAATIGTVTGGVGGKVSSLGSTQVDEMVTGISTYSGTVESISSSAADAKEVPVDPDKN